MKKSTLITTIAMIVVVVVALSTATYAWFSSSTNTYATQTITTTGTESIIVLVNDTVLRSGAAANRTGSFGASSALLTHTIYTAGEYTTAQAGIRAGLWAPHDVIAITETSNNSSTAPVTSDVVSFVQGKILPDGDTLKVASGLIEMSPDIIRVTSSKAQNINMVVYIAAKASASGTLTASEFAAQGVCFYLANASGVVAQTTYSYLNDDATFKEAENEEDIGDMVENDTIVISNNFTNYNSYAYNASTNKNGAKSITDSASANHRLTSTDVGTGFSAISGMNAEKATNLGISGYTMYYTLTVSLGSFAAGASTNYVLYTWLDGQYLDDAAGAADIAISYSFEEAV